MSRLAVAGRKLLLVRLGPELRDHRADHVRVEAERRRHAGLLHLVLVDIHLHRRPVPATPNAAGQCGTARPFGVQDALGRLPGPRVRRARRAGPPRGCAAGIWVVKNSRISARKARSSGVKLRSILRPPIPVCGCPLRYDLGPASPAARRAATPERTGLRRRRLDRRAAALLAATAGYSTPMASRSDCSCGHATCPRDAGENGRGVHPSV